MPDIRIVFVGAKFEGNIGAVCRSMANFDFGELYLVDPCPIGDDAYRRAKGGSDILDASRKVGTLEEALEGCFLVVGTSGIVTEGDKNYTRIPTTAREFAESTKKYPEKIAILFGREDTGLFQEELEKCDVLIHIPSSRTCPVLNVSHAANVVMYEIFQAGHGTEHPVPADPGERELMQRFFDDLLEAIEYPEHRKEGTRVMFRRLMGRAVPSKYEYNTVMGVFGDAARIIRRLHGPKWG
ncbi:MAG: RNA methyltransferase [Candidatus Methanomethylophilaceae archaeon]|jgi:TrmH family RNA methyltransferase|nr:RNA methyltransferase [Candidatus Methanomethylophilaceae archaeon]NLF33333.1 RNA methyltransferase [Thermoplasmatales archaeon]